MWVRTAILFQLIIIALSPGPIPSFSMLYAEKQEGQVSKVTCSACENGCCERAWCRKPQRCATILTPTLHTASASQKRGQSCGMIRQFFVQGKNPLVDWRICWSYVTVQELELDLDWTKLALSSVVTRRIQTETIADATNRTTVTCYHRTWLLGAAVY